ncbi:MAG: outer membrane protein TolC [Gammaproteobacteria bacterium]|jgi:outer membrane protein TolC
MTQASDATLASGKAKRMPVVEFGTAFTQLDDSPSLDLSFIDLGIALNLPSIVSNDNFISANATISMPIYASGLITSGINAAISTRDANRLKGTAFIDDIKLVVTDAFILVLRAGRALGVAKSNVKTLETHTQNVLDDENIAIASIGLSWRLFDGGQLRHRASALDHQAKSICRRVSCKSLGTSCQSVRLPHHRHR